MDFYTLKTTVAITAEVLHDIMTRIVFFCQPDIVGEPHDDAGQNVLRFAIRPRGLEGREDEVVALLAQTPHGFTPANTSLTKADRI